MEATAKFSFSDKNTVLRTSIRSALISFVISLILVLIFAFVVKLTGINANMIEIVNQIIKALSVFLGVLFGVSERNRWLLKGILSGIFFALISFGIFSLLGAKMSWGGFLGDLGLSIISAVLGSLLAAGRK